MITTAAIALLALAQGPANIQSFLQTGLQDATFTAHVEKASQAECLKINKDFGQSYRFKETTFKYKEPFKLRVEASTDDTQILYILNGATQYFKIPRANLKQKTDLSMHPGRRQTPLDFGVLTPALFDGFFEARFVRWDRATGDAVFDLTYPAKFDDTTRHRIWVDPQKKYVTKREWYNQPGRQIATFVYENPKNESGIWMPTKVTVRNVDDKIAAMSNYDSLKVNTGIPDSLFTGN